MPKRKMSAEEELVDLARRSSEIAAAKDKAIIKQVMERSPAAVEMIMRCLRSNGVDLTLSVQEQSPPEKTPKSRRAAAQEERLNKLKRTTHAAAAEEAKMDSNWIPTKYWTMDSLSVNLMISDVLAIVEPFALSAANLRASKCRGQPVTSLVFEAGCSLSSALGQVQLFDFENPDFAVICDLDSLAGASCFWIT